MRSLPVRQWRLSARPNAANDAPLLAVSPMSQISTPSQRQERLADALRANLKRRKAQMKGRERMSPPVGKAPDEGEADRRPLAAEPEE